MIKPDEAEWTRDPNTIRSLLVRVYNPDETFITEMSHDDAVKLVKNGKAFVVGWNGIEMFAKTTDEELDYSWVDALEIQRGIWNEECSNCIDDQINRYKVKGGQ
jgi:hypothetical protein